MLHLNILDPFLSYSISVSSQAPFVPLDQTHSEIWLEQQFCIEATTVTDALSLS